MQNRGRVRSRAEGNRGAALLVVLAALGPGLLGDAGSAPAAERPLVVASFYPLYEFARPVAGDRADVLVLVPAFTEPHDWEPTAQDVIRVRRARLFVYNGAGLEPWVERALKEWIQTGTVVVRATAGLPLFPASAQRSAALDPHVWLDPVLAQAIVERIRAGLVEVDPANAAAYTEHARAFTRRLAALHDAFTNGLMSCARREIITSHAAFGYLAKRYGLTMVGVRGVSPDAEPTPADMAALVRFAREKRVKYIFFETLVSSKLAETLAREVGAQPLLLNPIEGVTKAERAAGRDYVRLMEENLKNLRIGLGCR